MGASVGLEEETSSAHRVDEVGLGLPLGDDARLWPRSHAQVADGEVVLHRQPRRILRHQDVELLPQGRVEPRSAPDVLHERSEAAQHRLLLDATRERSGNDRTR